MQIRFIFRYIQYMVTSALRSEQFMFGVTKCQMGRNLCHITRCNQSFFSGMDNSQHRCLH